LHIQAANWNQFPQNGGIFKMFLKHMS
jgi:hypothetical protein